MKLNTLKFIATGPKGFTLVEMLVASSIFASLVIVATGALFQAQTVNTKVQQTQIILDGINLSMETMVRDIRYGYNYHCAQTFSTTTPPANFDLRRSCPLAIDGSGFAGKALIFHPVSIVDSTARVAYYIETQGGKSAILKATCTPTGGPLCAWDANVQQITGTDAYIQNLSFFVEGANSTVGNDGTNFGNASDNTQPFITILVGGRTKPADGSAPLPFNVQYSTGSRGLDN